MTGKEALHHLKIESPQCTFRVPIDSKSQFSSYLSAKKLTRCIISSTSIIPEWLVDELHKHGTDDIHIMSSNTPLPITNLYTTPHTLGTDRICSIVGAFFECECHCSVLCIDCGTAITYDIINKYGEYLGGNISPGQDMRFKGLHAFTSRLPLINANGQITDIGISTETAIRNGVIQGINYEISGHIHHYKEKFPDLKVFFTGGNIENFVDNSKNYIFADKNLVLKGLNIILNNLHNK